MLNKKGWGLLEMLLLSGVIMVFLFIVVMLVTNFHNSFKANVNNNYYDNLEKKLVDSGAEYLEKYYDENLTSNGVTIRSGVLKSYGLDVNLVDREGNSCSGYVIASKSKGIVSIEPFINCKDYVTSGYEEWRN